MKKIKFSKKIFYLNSNGSIYWPEEKALVLGDLHLEKSSYFAKLGDFLPPYDSFETLSKLERTLQLLDVKKVILLGDIFHDKNGIKRLSNNLKYYLENLCKKYDVIWLIGNHDGNYRPNLAKFCNNYKINNIYFNHKSIESNNFELSGHYHPKATTFFFKTKVSRPCFLISKSKIILPAFGSYTGGLDAKDKIFKDVINEKYLIYLTLNNKLIKIS
mgnify:CR=1 FL=1